MLDQREQLPEVATPDLYAVAALALRPRAAMTVSKWAAKNRMLSKKASSEEGKWKNERSPFAVEIMDAMSDSAYERVTLMAATQIVKTEGLLNFLGYIIDQDPGPAMLVEPTLKLCKAVSKERLAPMIEACPSLKAKVAPAKSRDGRNTTLEKEYPGGQLTLPTAESPSDLASRPIRYLLCDEVDRMGDTSEGDPIALAEERTESFWNRKIVKVSSPGEKGSSRIEAAYLEGDQRKYYVPCPFCGHEQILRFKPLKTGRGGVVWQKAVDAEGNPLLDEYGEQVHLPGTAKYCCEKCGKLWTDGMRYAAIGKGRWVAHAPENTGHASFWLNKLYALINNPLAKMVKKFLSAKKSPGKLKVFVNTTLAETWEEEGSRIEHSGLLALRHEYDRLPSEVCAITASADVQGVGYIEYLIVGWGPHEEAWQLEHDFIEGDVSLDDVYNDLGVVVSQHFESKHGYTLPINAVCIDAGHEQEAVLRFAARHRRQNVWAIKGKARGFDTPIWPEKVSRSKKTKRLFHTINVDLCKMAIKERVEHTITMGEAGQGVCIFRPMWGWIISSNLKLKRW
jgi:phage terminase large subunit GpA-like protein